MATTIKIWIIIMAIRIIWHKFIHPFMKAFLNQVNPLIFILCFIVIIITIMMKTRCFISCLFNFRLLLVQLLHKFPYWLFEQHLLKMLLLLVITLQVLLFLFN